MGSVKDLEVIEKPTRDTMGVGRFHFSDRYSVFDWGEMPDRISGKGAALCIMGAYCFEKLEEKGIRTHYRGMVDKRNRILRFDELKEPSNIMEFNLVNVYKPKAYVESGKLKYDYSIFAQLLRNYLLPLEIIYRNGLPEGSSIFKRLKQGAIRLEELGLESYPIGGEKLARPILEVSTKLEKGDHYLSWEEAKRIAGLNDREVDEVKGILLKVDETITEIASKAGLVNEDGKIELAFDSQRELMVVDVVGTLDECRFTYKGFHVSKEITRAYYRQIGWADEVEKAKRNSKDGGIENWKTLVKKEPPKLNLKVRTLVSQIYMAAANELTGKCLFDVPKLADVLASANWRF